MALLLHPAANIALNEFTVHPSTVIGLAGLGALYHWRARQAPTATTTPTTGQRGTFYVALALTFLSLNGWLHDLSDYFLFSAHMVQHLLLTLVVPPLLILGTPGWMLRPALKIPWVNSLAHRVTSARSAFLIFNITLAAWHV